MNRDSSSSFESFSRFSFCKIIINRKIWLVSWLIMVAPKITIKYQENMEHHNCLSNSCCSSTFSIVGRPKIINRAAFFSNKSNKFLEHGFIKKGFDENTSSVTKIYGRSLWKPLTFLGMAYEIFHYSDVEKNPLSFCCPILQTSKRVNW